MDSRLFVDRTDGALQHIRWTSLSHHSLNLGCRICCNRPFIWLLIVEGTKLFSVATCSPYSTRHEGKIELYGIINYPQFMRQIVELDAV